MSHKMDELHHKEITPDVEPRASEAHRPGALLQATRQMPVEKLHGVVAVKAEQLERESVLHNCGSHSSCEATAATFHVSFDSLIIDLFCRCHQL